MDPDSPILTLGYGRRPVGELIRALREAGATVVVDVRSAPYSRRRPEFSHRAMESWVPEAGIRYLYLGDALGGRPDDPSSTVGGRLMPARRWRHPAFRRGLERLVVLRDAGEVACLLCAEEDPGDCHRFHLVGEALHRDGIPVRHLLADGEVADHESLTRDAKGGQIDLFS